MTDIAKPEEHLPPEHKNIVLQLVYFKPTNSYQVVSITNTTWYAPDDWLSRDIVRELCNRPNWEVQSAQSHFFSAMIGNIKSVAPVPIP